MSMTSCQKYLCSHTIHILCKNMTDPGQRSYYRTEYFGKLKSNLYILHHRFLFLTNQGLYVHYDLSHNPERGKREEIQLWLKKKYSLYIPTIHPHGFLICCPELSLPELSGDFWTPHRLSPLLLSSDWLSFRSISDSSNVFSRSQVSVSLYKTEDIPHNHQQATVNSLSLTMLSLHIPVHGYFLKSGASTGKSANTEIRNHVNTKSYQRLPSTTLFITQMSPVKCTGIV